MGKCFGKAARKSDPTANDQELASLTPSTVPASDYETFKFLTLYAGYLSSRLRTRTSNQVLPSSHEVTPYLPILMPSSKDIAVPFQVNTLDRVHATVRARSCKRTHTNTTNAYTRCIVLFKNAQDMCVKHTHIHTQNRHPRETIPRHVRSGSQSIRSKRQSWVPMLANNG